ncbi:hypothetical protein D0X99_14625 [Algoriphagus lacus]|uniref:Gliding motility-associated C-terminal domain-containing protein n=1 Tax=Algoriphagus lacus TaxID=2056311 RepID=A0A418PPN1_9BACT|nr:gliding motility-associated C-terminal domain-containing protein [Algoriphagus lacus]RIW14037.1 hypothetical protein D0X99_14625 [Algoriphagus lacus]
MKKVFSRILFIFSLFMLLAFTGGAGILLFDRLGENFPFTSVNPVFIDPELTGPDRLCNVFGSVIGDFFGGGDPAKDVYSWEILGPAGQSLFKGTGGAGFQTISYTFSITGVHQVKLEVSRGGKPIGTFSKNVEVSPGPIIVLKSSYQICENQEIELQAIDPTTSVNFSSYEFEWRNESGVLIGAENNQKVNQAGNYEVSFFFKNSLGENECFTTLTTSVSIATGFSLVSSSTSVCPDEEIVFSTEPPIDGEWFIQKQNEPLKESIGTGTTIKINPISDLVTTGEYSVFFQAGNNGNASCLPESSISFTYFPKPEFEILEPIISSGCNTPDGTIRIKAITPLEGIYLDGQSPSGISLSPGDIFEIPNLKSGTYTVIGSLGSCANSLGTVVPLDNPPPNLEFEILDIKPEVCTPTGKLDGAFTISLLNGPSTGVSYRLINERGAVVLEEKLSPGLLTIVTVPGGTYFVEIFDEDLCSLPQVEELVVPNLDQVEFFIPESLSVCQSFDFIPETSQALEFTLTAPDGTVEIQKAGEAFSITQAGKHTLVGVLPGQSNICPTLKELMVTLVPPVDFEPLLIKQDCFGNQTYRAIIKDRAPEEVVFSWYNEKDELVGTGEFLFPFSYGTYKLDVQPADSEACPIPPKEFVVKEPVLSVDVSLESTKLCEFGPRAVINLSTTYPEEVTDIEWRRFDETGQITELPEFRDRKEVTVDVAGTYEASVFSIIPSIEKNCELGRSTIQVDLIPNKVTFDIPGNLSICDPYQLIPQSTSPLEFSLIYPDGNVETKSWNEAFTIDQAGLYTILGYDPDIKGPLCPEQKTFEVTINSPVQFQPVLNNLSCEGIYEYQAQVDNYAPDQVDYFWRDPAGNLVGSSAVFTTSTYGTFTLEVQPKGSIPCKIDPQSFEVAIPVLQVATKIIAGPLCPDQPNAALEVDADFTEISTIEWWFTDINNNRIQLISETNKKEILASREGTYEVIVRNSFNCILGRDQVLVLRSSDQVRPALEESYQVCPRYEIAPTLNPGNFAQYEWYFEDALVGNSPTFKPLQIGTYKVIVYSTEGCAYETTFITEEECELRAVFPNAIQPGNPEKPFLIYTNYLIDELEVWIFNRWGEVIFHCKNTDLLTEESTCLWDGYFDGQKIPPGSYAYRLNFKNLEKNISKEQLGSILVID